MSNLPKPTNANAQELILKRTVTSARHRDTQPAIEQPRQDTLPSYGQP